MSLAISLDMVNVVVVVVVMILAGSLGSADRFDWENLREERLRHASSLVLVCSMKEKAVQKVEGRREENEMCVSLFYTRREQIGGLGIGGRQGNEAEKGERGRKGERRGGTNVVKELG